jgi:hypothetical protein
MPVNFGSTARLAEVFLGHDNHQTLELDGTPR